MRVVYFVTVILSLLYVAVLGTGQGRLPFLIIIRAALLLAWALVQGVLLGHGRKASKAGRKGGQDRAAAA